jgi:hypothetical protein
MWSILNIITNAWLLVFIPLILIILISRVFISGLKYYFSFKKLVIATVAWILSGASLVLMGAQDGISDTGMLFFKLYVAMGLISIAVLLPPIKALQKSLN